MDIKQLERSDYTIFKAIVGSKLYGLDTPSSDTDIKCIYVLPLDILLKRSFQDQVNDNTNDQVFYEVIKFLDLATKANPNILELLYVPDEFILKTSMDYELIREHRSMFLTKSIKNSLGGYAVAQIKKSRGRNKKIVNPIAKERKSPLDFCSLVYKTGSISLKTWLLETGYKQEQFGLVNIDAMHNNYLMYWDQGEYTFRGILKEGADELRLSSIPKEAATNPYTLYFASENYSNYCKDYKEYWEWMENRNESRYASVEKHNKGYDGKHMMHCFRLLEMGIDAAKTGELIVNRPEREWLLNVREGVFEYEDLITQAEEKLIEMEELVEKSDLPTMIDGKFVDELLLDIHSV